MNKLFIITLITLCLGACTSGHNTYSEFRNLPKEGWAYNDTINFIPTITDSVTQGNLSIALRHNNNYHYSNLWVEINYPINDSTIKSDTINIPLADIYGKWHGKGIGPSIQIEKNISENIEINKVDYFSIRHIMRVDTLKDIEQIGLFFIPNTEQ
ncbi:MAG: gliding motility lipoprotein GldH [Muribaculaceae bacterium]|nr:gliding motility lipoprotein GldH [Muribaculaceae bacterium]